MNFSSGDVVRLKSGGPPMTVADYAGNGRPLVRPIIDCEWFAGDVIRRDAFEETNLVLIEKYVAGVAA